MLPDIHFMRQALAEAEKASHEGEVPVGSVVVSNDRIIARSHNLVEMLNDVTAHAEIQAITAAAENLGGKYLHDCTLYVTLEPCVMCAGALAWSQISRIVYGASDEQRGFSRIHPSILHPKTTVVSGIMAEECQELILRFFKERRT